MQLHPLDISIIIGYLLLTIFIGIYISKRASKGLDSYFLGENSLPWYVLGISNASGMFDITGTMWLVYLGFVYGLKSVWIPWMWPTFNQIFLMVFLAIWLRRSNVLTGAEWITTRFGKGQGAKLAHIIVVVFALISVVGFLAYDFQGIGKFAALFLPWDLSPNTYAVILMSITAVYVISGGMFSVVFTEVLQFIIMTIASVAVGIIAMMRVSPEMLDKVIPEGWKSIFFGWKLDMDWSGYIESVNSKILDDGYSLFTIIFMMMLFKGILISMAGPAPNYDMQRILATKSPKEAAKMSGFVSVALMFPRYLMVAGLTVLALTFYSPELRAMGPNIDFELVLPYAIKNFIPLGVKGLLLAGLLAAFMSTFAATVNAAPAYIVNDIYKKYINPSASNKRLIFMSYLSSLVIVIIGFVFGFLVESINEITLWIVNALWGGYTAANMLKWYWWRFNGHGYFWGMVFGLAASMAVPKIFPDLSAINGFPIIFVVSIIACIIGTLVTKPEDDELLIKFYTKVRPWGFWEPIYKKVIALQPDFKKNKDFKRDSINIAVGIVWQVSLMATPFFLIIKDPKLIVAGFAVIILTSLFLKFNWWDKLSEE